MRRRGGKALVAGLGGAALLLCLGRAPSFVAPPSSAPDVEGRRAAVASLLVPLAGAAASSPAYAEEVKGVTFTAPDDTWELAPKPQFGAKGWLKKDKKEFGILFAFPTDYKASITQIGNKMVTPTFRGPSGVEVLKYELGDQQDDLELASHMITDAKLSTETFISWIVGGQGVTMPTRQWYRKVKQNGKEALLMGISLEKDAEKMRPEIEKFFGSVTLA